MRGVARNDEHRVGVLDAEIGELAQTVSAVLGDDEQSLTELRTYPRHHDAFQLFAQRFEHVFKLAFHIPHQIVFIQSFELLGHRLLLLRSLLLLLIFYRLLLRETSARTPPHQLTIPIRYPSPARRPEHAP